MLHAASSPDRLPAWLVLLPEPAGERHAAPECPTSRCTRIVRACVATARASSGSVKAAIGAAARMLKLRPRRVAAFWWGEVRSVSATEWQGIEAHSKTVAVERVRFLEAELQNARRTAEGRGHER